MSKRKAARQTSAKTRRVEQSGSVMNCQQFHHVIAQAVNDPVVAEDDLANLGVVLFGNDSSRFWKSLKTFRRSKYVNDEQAGVMGRVVRDEICNRLKIANGLCSPPYFSHLAIFSLTWA